MQRYVHSVKNDIANDLAIEEAKQLHGIIGQEISAIEQATLDARMALEQKIPDTQMDKSTGAPDEQKPSVAQSSTTPGKPFNGYQ